MLSPNPCVVALLVAPLVAVATRTGQPGHLGAKQANGAPTPCVRIDPPPSQEETDARFNTFVDAFVGPSKSLFEAFKYIAEDYIVGRSHLQHRNDADKTNF